VEFGIGMGPNPLDVLTPAVMVVLLAPLPLLVIASVLLLTVGRRPPVVVHSSLRILSLCAATTCLLSSVLSLAVVASMFADDDVGQAFLLASVCLISGVMSSAAWIGFARRLVVGTGGISVVPRDHEATP
jgi:hypothetical protein